MNSESGFVKRIPVEIQDVRFKSEQNADNPARKTDDIMRKQLGDPYPTTEGKPYGVSENQPAAAGAPGINTDLHADDTGQVSGRA
jgi:hypothetical protein